MRLALVTALLAATAVSAEPRKNLPYDVDGDWFDARVVTSFALGTGGRPAYFLPSGAGESQAFNAPYSYVRGTAGFELDTHLPRFGFGSALHVAPSILFRLHFTFGPDDVLEPLPDGAMPPGSRGGGLGYAVALGDGVQLIRIKGLLLLGYFMVGLDGRPRWYSSESFLWADPTLFFGLRFLHESEHWRVRAGYEVQPPFFNRTEHRLELSVGFRPFDNGVGPFFGLRLFGHYGQTPVPDGINRDAAVTYGMSDGTVGLGLEVAL